MYKLLKRLLDIALSTLLLLTISPFMLLIVLIVRYKMGKPFYFTQIRTTRDMREFKLIKFRSMTEDRDSSGNLLPDEMRRTKFGNFLRQTSLDELPELINIIKGDMSIIGPRPLLPEYNEYYKKNEFDRFKVKGGLIPPEVLYFKPNPSWDEQLAWEAEYGRNCSFLLDLKIFFSVFIVLYKRNKENFGHVSRVSLSSERKEMKSN